MKKNIKKIQVVFNKDVPGALANWEGIMNVEKIGRVYNIITREYNEDFKAKLDKLDISFREEIDISLEDMFIYSVGGGEQYEELLK